MKMSRTEIPTIDKDVLAILNGEKTFQEVFPIPNSRLAGKC